MRSGLSHQKQDSGVSLKRLYYNLGETLASCYRKVLGMVTSKGENLFIASSIHYMGDHTGQD